MQGLPSILSLFLNVFYRFNNTGARMLDFIYHMTLKLLKTRIFVMKPSRFCNLYAKFVQRYIGCHNVMLIHL